MFGYAPLPLNSAEGGACHIDRTTMNGAPAPTPSAESCGWIDLHAHLAELSDEALAQQLQRARSAGLSLIVNTATALPSARQVIRQCQSQPMLRAAAGITPFDVGELPADWDGQLGEILQAPSIVAVGEIGLDDSNPQYPPLSAQQPVFERQCVMARELDLPAIIHSRGAEELVIDQCTSLGLSKVVFHCFTGSPEALRRLIEAGYYVSFSGIITFKNSAVAELVKATPLERLFIETDSPYLAPVPHRGKPNEPARVALVGEKVAALKGIEPAVAAARVRQNFADLFGSSFL
jgi:TatD DNase family protein